MASKETLNFLRNNSGSQPEKVDYKPVTKVEGDEGEYVLTIPSGFKFLLPHETQFIDCVDKEFHEAVRHIKGEYLIGVGVEGREVGRFGKVCLISIATEQRTILFDIFTLKKKAFEHGLKDIFENPDIQKVIHDCRQVSDAFYRRYDTKLVNVFDTLVSHLLISKSHARSRREIIFMDLFSCLEKYLNMKFEDFCILRSNPAGSKQTIIDWGFRPLPYALRDLAIQNVIYLRHLKELCTKNMLGEFYRTVSLCNEVARDHSSWQLKQDELSSDPGLNRMFFDSLFIRTMEMGECFCNENSFDQTDSFTKYFELVETMHKNKESEGEKQPSENEKQDIVQSHNTTRKTNVTDKVIWPSVDTSNSSQHLNFMPAGMSLESAFPRKRVR